ncbi:VanZ family protein [Rhodoglobus sp.]
MFRSRFVVALCAALYFAVLASLAFVNAPGANGRYWLWPILAFIPVGAFLVCLFGRRRWWAALAFSVVAAAWLEAAQTVWMPAGYANVTDILLAALGAGLGVSSAAGVALWWEHSQRANSSAVAKPVRNLSSNRRASASNSATPLNLDR